MLTAVAVPLLFVAGSLAIDTTNAMNMKVRLQNAADSAALATAARLSEEENLTKEQAKAFALKFVQGQVQEDFGAFDGLAISPVVTIDPVESGGRTIWKVAVSMSGSQKVTPMARVMGKDRLNVQVVGKSESAGEAQGAFSMVLVLDKSGSMDWKLGGEELDEDGNAVLGPDGKPINVSSKKIDVLKIAVASMIKEFEQADPEEKFVRLGATSYDTNRRGTTNLNFNLERTETFVNGLRASGGTDSTKAFKWAYRRVTSQSEIQLHKQKNGQVPSKFVVFMTDGDNNYNSADVSTKQLCDKAKNDGVEVFTVAFAAPERGRRLLSYCATSSEHSYSATSSAQLIAAFKNIGNAASKVISRLTE
ncbi:VWA domain-containing protein [Hoeflea sp.]|uniref:vWA domain-containing protein n=1 Tax=Hoeflea sp. TaxID=1940281 RepID=UPI003749F3AF